MALPSSGQITLKQIGSEFGTSPTLKSNYGKGGASSSGDITIKEFYGRSNRTDNYYEHYGSTWSSTSSGYALYQQSRSSADESYPIADIILPSWGGVYTTAGGDEYFGFDYITGLASELGQWNYIQVNWGGSGETYKYGRYEWFDVNIGGYDFTVIDGLYPASITNPYGETLMDYVAGGYGFTVTLDNRL
jgi:hypothetical protein